MEEDDINVALNSLGMLSSETELHKEYKKTMWQSKLRVEYSSDKPCLTRLRFSSSFGSKHHADRHVDNFKRKVHPRYPKPYDLPWQTTVVRRMARSSSDNIHKELEKLTLKSSRKPLLDTVIESIPLEASSKFYIPLDNVSLNKDDESSTNQCLFTPITKETITKISIPLKSCETMDS